MTIRATDFYCEEDYYAALNERVATEAEADHEYSYNVGRAYPEHAWICSDRDVWYPNPFYHGAPQPHPESDDDLEALADTRLVYRDTDIPF